MILSIISFFIGNISTLSYLATAKAETHDDLNLVQLGQYNDNYGNPIVLKTLNNKLYCITSNDYVLIFDVLDPSNPELLFSYRGELYTGLDLDSNYLYLTSRLDGLRIYDINHPSYFNLIGQYKPAIRDFKDVFVSNNRAYLANDDDGLEIVDISDKTQPVKVSDCSIESRAYRIYVDNLYAYVTGIYNTITNQSGISVIDISNELVPTKIATFNAFNISGRIKINNNFAYVPDKYEGLEIYNVTNPLDIQQIGLFYPSDTEVESVYVEDNYCYLGTIDNGMFILDITDNTNPTKITKTNNNESIFNIDIEENIAFLGAGSDLLTYNIVDKMNPVYLTEFHTGGSPWDFLISDNNAIITENYGGIEILNISDLAMPNKIAYYSDNNRYTDLVKQDDYLYVIDFDNCIRIFDLSDITNPVNISKYSDGGRHRDIDIAGNYLYIADIDEGLLIIDITNPLSPTKVGQYSAITADSVKIIDDFAYIRGSHGHFHILDISNPISPVMIGSTSKTPSGTGGLFVHDNFAYVIELTLGFSIYNITDKTNPFFVNSYNDYSIYSYRGLYVDNKYAYVGSFDGLKIVNITDPFDLQLILEIDDTAGYDSFPVSVKKSDSLLYLVDAFHGFKIYDSDSDHDNITDYYENNIYFTNPNSIDTDNDNLTDYEEIFTYFKNPLESDTDLDGYSDSEEINAGTDPLDPDDHPTETTTEEGTISEGLITLFLIFMFSLASVVFMKQKLKK